MLVFFPLSYWDNFFGLYYHLLLIHGPVQYEIVCLRSVNTEANEHMFNSVKVVADRGTNRRPDNVVTKVLLHVQSKQIEQGPALRHFCSCCLTDVQHTAVEVWNELLTVNIALPLCDKDIRVFDTSGNFTGYRSAMNSNVDNVDNIHVSN